LPSDARAGSTNDHDGAARGVADAARDIAKALQRHNSAARGGPPSSAAGAVHGPIRYAAEVSFKAADRALLAEAEEVDIETALPDGTVHRTTIWIMVDGEDVFVRSVRGKAGRWYREAVANPAVAIHVGGRRMTASAIGATDPDSIERASDSLRRKYGTGESVDSMLVPDVLDTTIRLEPA
jgi:hypothetical protein